MHNNSSTNNFIKKKTVEDLEDNIFDRNHKIMFNIGDMAVLELLQIDISLRNDHYSICNIILELGEDGEYINKLVSRVQNKDLIKRMSMGLLDIDESKAMEYFKSLRNDIRKLLVCIKGYTTEISYIHEISGEILYTENAKKRYLNGIDEININKLYENVYTFLTKDMSTLPEKIIDLISVIPFKISRNKYYDIIKDTLLQNLSSKNEEEVDAILEGYKTIFNGAMAVGYGQRFDKYFRKTHMFNQLNIQDLTIEDIKEVHSDANKILLEMNRLTEVIKQIGYMANRYIILNSLYEKDYRFNKSKYAQIIEMWEEYQATGNEQEEKKIISRCQEQLRILEKSIKEDNLKIHKYMNIHPGDFNGIDEKYQKDLVLIKKLLAYINDISFEHKDFTFKKYVEEVPLNYLDEAIENFIEFINRNIRKMNNKQRKVRMRRLLCLTGLPFKKPDDFFSYLKNSIETNSTKQDLIINISMISEVMKKHTI